MPRSNVKYELTKHDEETNDYFLHHVQDYQMASKKAFFWHKMIQSIILISFYFLFSIGLTFYQKWIYENYVSSYFKY